MNTKVFYINLTHNTPYNTNMFLFQSPGGEQYEVQASLQLIAFGGTSEIASSNIYVYIVSDSDTSGSPVADGDDISSGLASFIIPDGWPRTAPGISGSPEWQQLMNFETTSGLLGNIPSRGRNLYLRVEEPLDLPDPNAEYNIRLDLSFNRVD